MSEDERPLTYDLWNNIKETQDRHNEIFKRNRIDIGTITIRDIVLSAETKSLIKRYKKEHGVKSRYFYFKENPHLTLDDSILEQFKKRYPGYDLYYMYTYNYYDQGFHATNIDNFFVDLSCSLYSKKPIVTVHTGESSFSTNVYIPPPSIREKAIPPIEYSSICYSIHFNTPKYGMSFIFDTLEERDYLLRECVKRKMKIVYFNNDLSRFSDLDSD
jgi:hypothetical protein